MGNKTRRQFGLWDSPISPASLAMARRISGVAWDSDAATLVWLEGRSGQGVLVAQSDDGDAPADLTAELNVRAEVGYGGGDFTVHGGYVYFVVKSCGQIHRQPLAGGAPVAITPPFGFAAAPVVSPDGRWVMYVHHDGAETDRLAAVDSAGKKWPRILTQGHDFYMQPRFSADGRRACWIAWDHPNMPWDGTLLYTAEVTSNDDGLPRLVEPKVIAGGPETAIFQPEFAADGRHLLYISDESGWGRIAAVDLDSGERRWLTPDGVEYAAPAWVQGMTTYAVSADGRHVVAAANRNGFQQLQRINIASGDSTLVAELAETTEVDQLIASPVGDRVALVGSGSTTPPRLVQYDFDSDSVRIVARSATETVPKASLSTAEPVGWTSTDGETVHGLFYEPSSTQFEGIGQPPLIVFVHGGPTGQVKACWKQDAQFFASRGYAVLFVNYRGSTGYGREYMLRLRGNWGICDVEDCTSGARYLADEGRIDPRRTAIMGGSAGGFTVLQTMVEHPEAFAAGVCLYGVANQFDLAADTHKFERRYTDSLLGPLPEAAAIYRERSPVFHAERIRRPLAVFQGDIDQVVPRDQSDKIVEALERSGTPHEYHVYEGEGHGWRKRETIEHFYRTVERFLRRYVLFQ